MKQSAANGEQSDFFTCSSIHHASLLRLVATAKTLDEFSLEVESLLSHSGIQARCTFHKQIDLRSLEDYFPNYSSNSSGASTAAEIMGDLHLARIRHITNTVRSSTHVEMCKCIQVHNDSLLLIPAPSSAFGLSWISLRIIDTPEPLHLSEEFIESLQWALFLQIERKSRNQICSSCSEIIPLEPLSYHSSDLTKRQNQIVILVRDEMANSDIGRILHISTSLVKLELVKIFKILGISNRKELFDPPRIP